MSKVLLGLGAGAAAAAGLSALVFVSEALALPALYAIGAGGYVVASKRWERLVPGILAIVVGLLGVVGALNLTLGRSGFDASWFASHAAALAITANMFIVASGPAVYWPELQPWLPITAGALMLVVIVVSLIVGDGLDDHAGGAAIAIGLLSLVSATPNVLLLRNE